VFFFFSSARETVGRFETFTIVSPSFVVFLTFLMQQLLTHGWGVWFRKKTRITNGHSRSWSQHPIKVKQRTYEVKSVWITNEYIRSPSCVSQACVFTYLMICIIHKTKSPFTIGAQWANVKPKSLYNDPKYRLIALSVLPMCFLDRLWTLAKDH